MDEIPYNWLNSVDQAKAEALSLSHKPKTKSKRKPKPKLSQWSFETKVR